MIYIFKAMSLVMTVFELSCMCGWKRNPKQNHCIMDSIFCFTFMLCFGLSFAIGHKLIMLKIASIVFSALWLLWTIWGIFASLDLVKAEEPIRFPVVKMMVVCTLLVSLSVLL